MVKRFIFAQRVIAIFKKKSFPTRWVSHSPQETLKWGERLASFLKPPRVVALKGELGAGKTVLAKGIAQGLKLGKKSVVSSPTFTLINEYKGKFPIYHLDLYRVNSAEEFCGLGYEDYFFGKGIALVEWGEKIRPLLPKNTIWVHLKIKGPESREIRCSSLE